MLLWVILDGESKKRKIFYLVCSNLTTRCHLQEQPRWWKWEKLFFLYLTDLDETFNIDAVISQLIKNNTGFTVFLSIPLDIALTVYFLESWSISHEILSPESLTHFLPRTTFFEPNFPVTWIQVSSKLKLQKVKLPIIWPYYLTKFSKKRRLIGRIWQYWESKNQKSTLIGRYPILEHLTRVYSRIFPGGEFYFVTKKLKIVLLERLIQPLNLC